MFRFSYTGNVKLNVFHTFPPVFDCDRGSDILLAFWPEFGVTPQLSNVSCDTAAQESSRHIYQNTQMNEQGKDGVRI